MHDIFQPSLPESFPFFGKQKYVFLFTSFTPTYASFFTLFLSVPGLHLQAGSAGLLAAYRPLLPPAQHLQQGQGGGAEPGRRDGRVRGEFNNLITRPPDRL